MKQVISGSIAPAGPRDRVEGLTLGSVLALMPDAYGGRGGIAQYGRDLIDATATLATDRPVISLARNGATDSRPRPANHVEEAGSASKASYSISAYAAMRRYRPDVVLCGHVHLLALGVALARHFRKPIVTVYYGIDAFRPRGWRCDDQLRRVDRVIAISRFTRDRLLGWSSLSDDVVSVLPNVMHPFIPPITLRDELRARLGFQGRQVILMIARMDRREQYKGHSRILDILPELLRELPGVLIVFVGDGDLVPDLRLRIDNEGLGEQVRLTGHVTDEERSEYLSASDALALPSTGEGYGFASIEGLAAGLPVLASNVDGGRDALGDGARGVLVDPRNREELVAGVVAAVRRGVGSPHVVPALSMSSFRERLDLIYRDVLERRT